MEKDILKELKYVLQEILLTAEWKLKNEDELTFLTSYWDEFQKQIEKWLLALAKVKEGEYEIASEILEEIEF